MLSLSKPSIRIRDHRPIQDTSDLPFGTFVDREEDVSNISVATSEQYEMYTSIAFNNPYDFRVACR